MRAFVAIPLPGQLVTAAAKVARDLAGDDRAWRLAREEGLHLTLRFLGELDEGGLTSLDAPLAAAARSTPPLELAVSGAGAFPSVKRARLLWLGIEERGTDGALASLAARLETVARVAGVAPEARPFSLLRSNVGLVRRWTSRARPLSTAPRETRRSRRR